MNFVVNNFRNALAVLGDRPEWYELQTQIREITRDEVLQVHESYRYSKKKIPAGAQTALNEVFRRRLVPNGWKSEVPLFPPGDRDLAKWTMDFTKRGRLSEDCSDSSFGVGVEVTFNHAEAIAWTLIRLNLAGESTEVLETSRLDVGVAVYPTVELKRWGRMDGAVGTYDRACLWLAKMKPVMPIPIAIIGLQPNWAPTEIFRGTQK